MTTWNAVSDELTIWLEDPTKIVEEGVRIAAFNRAQEHFALTHTAKIVRNASLTIIDGMSFALPADFSEFAGVRWRKSASSSWVWLTPGSLIPSEGDPGGYLLVGNTVMIMPNQSLADLLSANVELWYYATYTPVVDGASVLDLPAWALWAVINLALAYTLYPSMIGQAALRRFQTRREAGEPEDSLPKALALFFINIYETTIAKFPKQDRSIAYIQ